MAPLKKSTLKINLGIYILFILKIGLLIGKKKIGKKKVMSNF